MARLTFAALLFLIALIRGYYLLRFGLLPQVMQKPREWYDWAAEIGSYSVAVNGAWYIILGDAIPFRFDATPPSVVTNSFVTLALAAPPSVVTNSFVTLGLALFAIGVLLFGLSHFSLAQQWTWNIGLRDNHQMVQHGIYRFIRHPMYTAIGLWLIATPLIVQSWLGLVPLVGLPGLYLRAQAEEQLMLRTFGSGYTAYRKTAGMFLPHR